MWRSANCFLVVLLLFFSLGCTTKKIQVALTTDEFEVTTFINPKLKKFYNNKSKLEGQITVTNKTSYEVKYGNKFLKLKVNDNFTARTYKQTIASELIDFETVMIGANTTLSFPAYWVYSLPLNTVIQSMQLTFDEPVSK